MEKQNIIVSIGLILILLYGSINLLTAKNMGEKEINDPVKMSLNSFETAENIHVIFNECEEGGQANTCCEYWDISVTWSFTGPEIECSTGGEFQCQSDEKCDELEVD